MLYHKKRSAITTLAMRVIRFINHCQNYKQLISVLSLCLYLFKHSKIRVSASIMNGNDGDIIIFEKKKKPNFVPIMFKNNNTTLENELNIVANNNQPPVVTADEEKQQLLQESQLSQIENIHNTFDRRITVFPYKDDTSSPFSIITS